MSLVLKRIGVFGLILIVVFASIGCSSSRKYGVKPKGEFKKKTKCKCKTNKGGIYANYYEGINV